MRILITGINGFVGSNLVPYLAEENVIYGLDIISPEIKGVIKTYLWEDLYAGHIPEVDSIIHLAGKAHDTKNRTTEDEYFKVNRDLTIAIFDFFCAHPLIKKFVFFSTAKAAADKVEGILTENVVPSPVGPYGESKIAAEQYILSRFYEKSEIMKEKSVYIFRPCMIHGPGNKGNLNLLYNIVRKGIPWPLGAFENRRTFTSIGNICFAVNGVLSKTIPSGIYNMGDDDALSTNELIEEIGKSLGKKIRIWKLPKGLMIIAAKMGGILHLPLNQERLEKLTENYVSSNEKIKIALGVNRMPVDAREGLRVTLDSFK